MFVDILQPLPGILVLLILRHLCDLTRNEEWITSAVGEDWREAKVVDCAWFGTSAGHEYLTRDDEGSWGDDEEYDVGGHAAHGFHGRRYGEWQWWARRYVLLSLPPTPPLSIPPSAPKPQISRFQQIALSRPQSTQVVLKWPSCQIA